jgi:hypothetical protein
MAITLDRSNSDNPEGEKLYYGLRVISPRPSEDLEDVTFTGPVFPRVSSSLPGPETAEPGTSPTTT